MRDEKILVLLFVLVLCSVVIAAKSPSVNENRLADRHIEVQGNTCEDCHMEAEPAGKSETETCLECHISYDDIAQLTQGEEMNPQNHYGPVPCYSCHRAHSASILLCDECHSFGNETP